MKKSLIAGAGIAALGLAVVPFAGVFAADITTMTDTINVAVGEACTFDTNSNSHGASMAVDSKLTDPKKTSMNVKCNNTAGYQVTVTNTTDLDLGSTTGTTEGNGSIPFTTGTVAAGTAGWNAYKTVNSTTTYFATAESATASGVSNIVMESNQMTPTEGDSVDINYDIATSKNQAQGSYTGSITYTLTAKNTDTTGQ